MRSLLLTLALCSIALPAAAQTYARECDLDTSPIVHGDRLYACGGIFSSPTGDGSARAA